MCYYLIGNYEKAISSFKKMQIDTRTSLFYKAACHQMLEQTDIANNILELAFNESGMDIDKFITTQFFQDESMKNSLVNVLEAINA